MIEFDPAHVVGTGGAVGALLRQYVGRLVESDEFPLGTLAVNVLGTFLLGFVTFLGVDSTTLLLLGTGVCGSFTTFSSFSVQTVRLWETGDRLRAVVNAGANLLGAGLALGLAWGLAQVLV
uniref:fluoride efflux transporter CrcB n=1 Tax=Haloprofundus sp. MHR1 TaxID=2572921 RepID=UPI001F157D5B|nr:fluoride efflux transporter CrcB [Haloprofundus sp. MHR1]